MGLSETTNGFAVVTWAGREAARFRNATDCGGNAPGLVTPATPLLGERNQKSYLQAGKAVRVTTESLPLRMDAVNTASGWPLKRRGRM